MNNEPYLNDPQFQSVLVACLEKLERGEALDREELLERHAKFAQPLAEFLDDQSLLEQIASGLRDSMAAHATAASSDRLFDETIDSNPSSTGFGVADRIRYIGEYEILEEIARGGMGVVFKAKQRQLQRIVALKMILAGKLADNADVERFQREARAAGRLKHANIVPVHEVGQHDGHHYFTMDFIEGDSLAAEIRDESLPPKKAAELVKAVAVAIEFAHQHGTLHRDLKPANILIDANGQPHITDFGLAKSVAGDNGTLRTELTVSGQILGTPSYMSPEQADAKQHLIGPATDVYSLGAILYACLTGRAPFVADSPLDTMLQVVRKEPVSPRTLNTKVSRDLETICLKCLAKEPHKRYGTAADLAADLERFLDDRPVVARPVGSVAKSWRWAKRNPWIAALLTLSCVLLTAGTIVSTYFAIEANQRADAETKERQRADREAEAARLAESNAKNALVAEEKARDEAEAQRRMADKMRQLAELRLEERTRSLYALQLTRAHSIWRESQGEAASLLEDKTACPPELRDFTWRYLRHLTHRRIEGWNTGPTPVKLLDVSSDGSQVAAVGIGKTVSIWRSGHREPVASLKHETQGITAGSFSRDGKRLATSCGKTIVIWNIETGKVEHRLEHGGKVETVSFLPDGRSLISAGAGIIVWDAVSGESLRRLGDSTRLISHIALAGDRRRFLAAEKKGDIVLWDIDQTEPIRTVFKVGPPEGALDFGNRVKCLDISRDGAKFLFADAFEVHVYDLLSGKAICHIRDTMPALQAEWRSAVFSPDGRWLATCSGGHHVKLWDATTGAELTALTPFKGGKRIRFSSDGRAVLVGDAVGNLVWWRVPAIDGGYELRLNGGRLAISPQGDRMAAYLRGDISVWDTQRDRAVWKKSDLLVFRAAFSPDGKTLAGMLEGGQIRFWDADDGEQLKIRENVTRGEALVYIDQNRLAFSTGKSAISIWNLSTDEIFELDSGDRGVLCLAVSPDGRHLAAGHGIHPLPDNTPPGKVVVWDLATRKPISVLKGHDSFGVYDIAFSPDGSTLASCGQGIVLWDAKSFERRTKMTSHTAPAWSIDYAHDGSVIATGSMDGTIRLWDPKSGQQRLAMESDAVWVTDVSFSPDSNSLFSAGMTGGVRWWPAAE